MLQRVARMLIVFAAGLLVLGSSGARAEVGSYLLFDMASGEIIAAHEPTARWYPASLTKLMTAYVTFAAIERGALTLTSPVRISPQAHQQPPSRMGFPIGTVITVETALRIILTKSANDVSVALAEAVGGTQGGFVTRMNDTAATLGMSATSYDNPHGLPNTLQVTSARDLALLMMALTRDFPDRAGYFSMGGVSLGRKMMVNHNPLIRKFRGSDGMKTGFICASGFNLAATATRDGHRLGAVVLGGLTSRERDERTAELLAKGFEALAGGGEVTLDGFGDVGDRLTLTPVHGTRQSHGTVAELVAAPDVEVANRLDDVCGATRPLTRYDDGTVTTVAAVEEQRRLRLDYERRRAARDDLRRSALAAARPDPAARAVANPARARPRAIAEDALVPAGWQPSGEALRPYRNPGRAVPARATEQPPIATPEQPAQAEQSRIAAPDWIPSPGLPIANPLALAELRVPLGDPPTAQPLTYLDPPVPVAMIAISLGGADEARPDPLSGQIVGGGLPPIPRTRPDREAPTFGTSIDAATLIEYAASVRAEATEGKSEAP